MSVWRLGLDMGSNSIGWAVLKLEEVADGKFEPCAITDMGVRIFHDGRDGTTTDKKTGLPMAGDPLAVNRRLARGLRRNRDRRLRRIRLFAHKLVQFGLAKSYRSNGQYYLAKLDMSLDPYQCRARAAEAKITKDELARALFHICRRRGFLSNRKTDGDDKESSVLKSRMGELDKILNDRKITLGQYLHERIQQGEHVRFRGKEMDISKPEIAIYPSRGMYLSEFYRIRKIQGNDFLSDEQWDELLAVFSFQRPLKEQQVGLCTFEHGHNGREGHKRASRHLPTAHTFRIVQEVNNLRYKDTQGDQELNQEQREKLYSALESQKSMAFSKIRTLLKLDKKSVFNLESKSRKNLTGNVTGCDMRTIFQEHDQAWDVLESSMQNCIVATILSANDFDEFMKANKDNGWNFSPELVSDLSRKYYTSSTGHISLVCMEKLLPLMRKGMMYFEAAREVYGDHTDFSDFASGEVLEQLPYYGKVLKGVTAPIRETPESPEDEVKYGKISNPTVHVALNQLRKLVNALIDRYGNPYEVHIELARELKTHGKNYAELVSRIAENTKNNDQNRKKFEDVFGRAPSGLDMAKMRLWNELSDADTEDGAKSLAKIDIYTGRVIGFDKLFSDEIEIEHILPFSRTYDNSMNNKTITFRAVNRRKGNSLPYDFALSDALVDAEEMAARAMRKLPRGKRWRFQKDAAAVYERILTKNMTNEELAEFDADKSGSFLDRQLVDTQYISRVAARYLVPVVGDPSRVLPVKGHITNFLRNKWNINAYKAKGGKNERQDHRHHAEDAFIVALSSRSLLKRIAVETRNRQEERKDYSSKIIFPQRPQWATNESIKNMMDSINVSFKQDHSRENRLFADTAYGILAPADPWRKEGYHGVVSRSILSLKESEQSQIRDVAVRKAVVEYLEQPEIKSIKKYEDRLKKLAQDEIRIGSAKKKVRIRKVRIVIKNQSMISIESAKYKAYTPDSIAFCDVWHLPKYNKKGKMTGWKYQGMFVSYAEAKKYENDEATLANITKPHPAAKKVMRLFKQDMVLLTDHEGREVLYRVAGYSTTVNALDIRPHTETAGKQNFKAITGLIEKMYMRKVHVTVDGRILK